MRRPFTMLTVVTVGGLVALAAVAALGASLMRASASTTRTVALTLAPAPNDLALTQVSFHPAHSERLSPASLRVAVSGPFGDDYLAMAAVRAPTPGVLRALVLVVNRPSPLMEPAAVSLKLVARRSLGAASIHTLENPLASASTTAARAGAAAKAAPCDLPLHGVALTAGELRTLSSRGSPLPGFTAAGAVAQAYDLACALPYDATFKRAIEGVASSPPPVGKLPGEGCKPAPGYACPG